MRPSFPLDFYLLNRRHTLPLFSPFPSLYLLLSTGTAVMVAAALKNDIMEISDRAEAILYPHRNTAASPVHTTALPANSSPKGLVTGEGDAIMTANEEEDDEIVIDFSGTGTAPTAVTENPLLGSSTAPVTASFPLPVPAPCSLFDAMVAGLKPRLAAVAFATPPCTCEVTITTPHHSYSIFCPPLLFVRIPFSARETIHEFY